MRNLTNIEKERIIQTLNEVVQQKEWQRPLVVEGDTIKINDISREELAYVLNKAGLLNEEGNPDVFLEITRVGELNVIVRYDGVLNYFKWKDELGSFKFILEIAVPKPYFLN